jgi:hypothetical protein
MDGKARSRPGLLVPDSRAVVSFVARCLPRVRLPAPSATTTETLRRHYAAYAAMFDAVDRGMALHEEARCRPPEEPPASFVGAQQAGALGQLPRAWCADWRVTVDGRALSVTFHVKSGGSGRGALPALRRVACNVLTLVALFGKPENARMHIQYHAAPAKKLLPAYRAAIGPANINSGSTCNGCSSIDIWRGEEVGKVVVHELVHALRLDLPTEPADADLAPMYRDFRLSTDGCGEPGGPEWRAQACATKLLPNEAITELTAIVLHTMYVCRAMHGAAWLPRRFWALLDVERRWGLFQTAKVTINCGYRKPSDFASASQPRLFKQKSSVFSYFVLKAATLYHIDRGVAMLRLTSGAPSTSASVAALHDAALSPEFWRDADACEQVGDDCRGDDFPIRTLRMSAISID